MRRQIGGTSTGIGAVLGWYMGIQHTTYMITYVHIQIYLHIHIHIYIYIYIYLP